ncbi:MAG: hypothetical protein R2788_00365 [Saprospiraceae bacterium]
MEKSLKVRLLNHKQPHKVKLQLLSNGKILEMSKLKFEHRWDTGRYEVVNHEAVDSGVFNAELFEL